jgi:D-alanyl-D-alanine carboxypeptidase
MERFTMRTKVAFIVSALLLLIAGTAVASAAKTGAPGARPAPAYALKLEKELPAVLKANAIPGALVLIRSPEKGDWTGTFGTAVLGKDVPMTLADHFRIGSNTKTMTSTVILQLVEEGKLKLSDPISKFRPDVPDGKNITIEDLSEMRSGLFSYTFDEGFNEAIDRHPRKAWTPNELLKIAFSHPSPGTPGGEFEYNNTNIALLGVVIQKLTGMSASAAFKQRIFEPLGLTHTYLPGRKDWKLPSPHAQGYQFGTNVETISSYAVPKAKLKAALNGTYLPNNDTGASPSWAWTAGGAVSTPADLATYAQALGGGGLLSPKMQKLRLASLKPLSADSPPGVEYGLGLAQFAPGIIGHDGQLPGFSSFMSYDVNNGDTIIVATNLSASAVTGENAAVEVAKAIIGSFLHES